MLFSCVLFITYSQEINYAKGKYFNNKTNIVNENLIDNIKNYLEDYGLSLSQQNFKKIYFKKIEYNKSKYYCLIVDKKRGDYISNKWITNNRLEYLILDSSKYYKIKKTKNKLVFIKSNLYGYFIYDKIDDVILKNKIINRLKNKKSYLEKTFTFLKDEEYIKFRVIEYYTKNIKNIINEQFFEITYNEFFKIFI